MQPNNLTALDFEDVKASIKSYLRTRSEFTDYDFDGSALSYMVDALAYNTYYTAFNANMSLNEAFLPSSTVRDNVVNIAKLMNYTPRSVISSRASVKIDVQTSQANGVYPSSVTLKKGSIATGGNFVWNILRDTTAEVSPTTGIGTFPEVCIYEGQIVSFQYIVNTFARQTYAIPSAEADLATLKVSVKANETATAADIYNQVDTVTGLTASTRAYFLSEGEDMRFEVRFGDDSVGRALKDGEVVQFEYLVTSGKEANEVNSFGYVGTAIDATGTNVVTSDVTLTVLHRSQMGTGAETIESIKYNAPRYYSSQYRAVTAQDYALITQRIYDNADSVVAYGGDSLNPPIYGKVFIAIKTKTGSLLNDATKKEISANLRKYAMASIDPVVVDPDNVYIYTKIFALYDTGAGSSSSQIKTDIQTSINDWATQTQINNFNSTFRGSAYEKAITLANNAITDVSLQTTTLKYITPNSNQTNTYCISTGSGLYNSAPSKDGDDGTCKKEPVLLSGTFRTADRPGVDQQFEDDGYGNLRIFYNTGTKKVYTNNSIGTVNYDTGEICFGPVNVISTGTNVPSSSAVNITDTVTGAGSVTDPSLLPGDLRIPVVTIPANSGTIPASTPGTIINIISPEVTVSPIGTTPPASVPLNSLTPTIFDDTPSVVEVAPIDNSGGLNTSTCFS
nr:gp6 baseplate wedge protein [uncultured Mediterranean phage uvMED]